MVQVVRGLCDGAAAGAAEAVVVFLALAVILAAMAVVAASLNRAHPGDVEEGDEDRADGFEGGHDGQQHRGRTLLVQLTAAPAGGSDAWTSYGGREQSRHERSVLTQALLPQQSLAPLAARKGLPYQPPMRSHVRLPRSSPNELSAPTASLNLCDPVDEGQAWAAPTGLSDPQPAQFLRNDEAEARM